MGGVINGFPTDLGSILVRMGACSEDQVRVAEEAASVLGCAPEERLLATGAVTAEEVREATRLQTSLRSASEMPVVTLVRLYDHAVGNYHRSTRSLSERLEQMKR